MLRIMLIPLMLAGGSGVSQDKGTERMYLPAQGQFIYFCLRIMASNQEHEQLQSQTNSVYKVLSLCCQEMRGRQGEMPLFRLSPVITNSDISPATVTTEALHVDPGKRSSEQRRTLCPNHSAMQGWRWAEAELGACQQKY